jgi:hypothetical protein
MIYEPYGVAIMATSWSLSCLPIDSFSIWCNSTPRMMTAPSIPSSSSQSVSLLEPLSSPPSSAPATLSESTPQERHHQPLPLAIDVNTIPANNSSPITIPSNTSSYIPRGDVEKLIGSILSRSIQISICVIVYVYGYQWSSIAQHDEHPKLWLMFTIPSLAMNFFDIRATYCSVIRQINNINQKLLSPLLPSTLPPAKYSLVPLTSQMSPTLSITSSIDSSPSSEHSSYSPSSPYTPDDSARSSSMVHHSIYFTQNHQRKPVQTSSPTTIELPDIHPSVGPTNV